MVSRLIEERIATADEREVGAVLDELHMKGQQKRAIEWIGVLQTLVNGMTATVLHVYIFLRVSKTSDQLPKHFAATLHHPAGVWGHSRSWQCRVLEKRICRHSEVHFSICGSRVSWHNKLQSGSARTCGGQAALLVLFASPLD
jgi:hypothetical protein